VELIDNAIAAIISEAACQGRIYINFNFGSTIGSIEHSGGKTFPQDKVELIRVLTYGGIQATRLNEHGCGLKSSLAILDPTNSVWKIYFKYVENGLLKVKSISAPYSNKMRICDELEWPGVDKTAENGTYILFPVSKERFVNMYQKKTALMEDLHDRIKCHFTHMWMKLDEFIEGKLRMARVGDCMCVRGLPVRDSQRLKLFVYMYVYISYTHTHTHTPWGRGPSCQPA
jgi:hypothetical protein